jgi:predicted transcriptional regulator
VDTMPSIMRLGDIRALLDAVVLAREQDMAMEIERAYCADLMSDVLAFSISNSLLITGLTNTQVIRTAEVATIKAIVFIQNKRPDILTISLADEKKIPLLVTDFSMFDACGLLFEKGLRSCSDPEL